MQRVINFFITCSLFGLGCFCSCSDKEYSIPEAKSGLQNDCIKRSIGPNLIGGEIEFAYAMALQANEGNLTEARVEASIPGAEGTWLENHSYYTNGSGDDVGIAVGNPSTTTGNQTKVTFNKDTNAATLRYYYKVPEEARGKQVSFKFSATASNGKSVSYDMGPYDISRMDMALDLQLTDGDRCYLSIEDMAVYNAAEAATMPDKIDLVYLYRSIPNITFNHSLVSPAAENMYLPGVVLPPGVSRSTNMEKAWGLRDRQLARGQYGVYVDDLDFQKIDVSNAPNFAINLREEAGVWLETADEKYKAYIFINDTDEAGKKLTVSMKRYTN